MSPQVTRLHVSSRNRGIFPQTALGISSGTQRLLLVTLDRETRRGGELGGNEGAESPSGKDPGFPGTTGTGVALLGTDTAWAARLESGIQLEDNVAVRPGLYKLDINKFRLESSRFLIRL